MIKRSFESQIRESLTNNKLLVLKAPINSGREALLRKLIPEQESSFYDLKDKKTFRLLNELSAENFPDFFPKKKTIVLKEAQLFSKLQNLIELILNDASAQNLVCICSSDPPLDELLKEVLLQNQLYFEFQAPSFIELSKHFGLIDMEKNLEKRLIFGNYPGVFSTEKEILPFLKKTVNDLLDYTFSKAERINKKENLHKLLRFLALNTGEQLSYNLIGSKCALDNETVERYIKVLEKANILIKLPVLFNGKRYELSKSHQFYFCDNGIRNAFLNDFSPLEFRFDTDILWKNWLISEKLKQKSNKDYFFWLTHTNQQMDFIEKSADRMTAYKFVWDKEQKVKTPKLFETYYPASSNFKITRLSYWNFLAKE